MYLAGRARTRVVAPPALRAGWVLEDETRAIRAVGAGPALAAVLRALRDEAPADPPGVAATGAATARLLRQLAAVLGPTAGLDAAAVAAGCGPVELGILAVELARILADAGHTGAVQAPLRVRELVAGLVAAAGDARRLELVAALFGDDDATADAAVGVLQSAVAALAAVGTGLVSWSVAGA